MSTNTHTDIPAAAGGLDAGAAQASPALSADPTAGSASNPTHIRSFVHRRSHITPGQKEALDRLMPLWSLPYRAAPLDLQRTFGRSAPTILEIGFGMGETTAAIAAARPGDNFLGVGVCYAGGGARLKRI